MGGSYNAFTSYDLTAYTTTFPTEFIDTYLEYEADRMSNLIVTDEQFKNEMNVIKEERKWRQESNIYLKSSERFQALSYMTSPYRNPIIGWQQDLDRMTKNKYWNGISNGTYQITVP